MYAFTVGQELWPFFWGHFMYAESERKIKSLNIWRINLQETNVAF